MENRLILLILAVIFLVGCTEAGLSESASSSNDSEEIPLDNSVFEESDESKPTEESELSSPEPNGSDIVSNESEETSSDNSEFEESNESKPTEESEVSPPEPNGSDIVLISDYIPEIRTDIRYATENNFTGKIIYESDYAYLRYGTVKKLLEVQNELKEAGYELLIWDAYRPTEAQWKLWEICPDPSFVSDPNNGYSSHSRGNTVDITIVRSDGSKVEMPSGFDEFTELADRDYSDVSKTAGDNAKMLEDIMKKHGFKGYRKEWWHYSDTVEYDVVAS